MTNGSGIPINGLDKDNFTLKEDGVAQTIRSFEENGAGRSHSVAGKAITEDILLLDEVNTRYADATYARHCLRRLIEKPGAKLEGPTSLLALTGDGLAVLQGPTQDGNALLRALDGHNPTLPPEPDLDWLRVLDYHKQSDDRPGTRLALRHHTRHFDRTASGAHDPLHNRSHRCSVGGLPGR